MKAIEVCLTPSAYDKRELVGKHSAVAVDILRATTAVCAAFWAGARSIVPLTELSDLERYRDGRYLLAAERGGQKVEGATCGNSPTEYLTMSLEGKDLAYSTTNGTRAILTAKDADATLVGAFANISKVIKLLTGREQDVVIVCSGWEGAPCLEDTLFAGELAKRLLDSGAFYALNDSAMMATDLFEATIVTNDNCSGSVSDRLFRYCAKATHVHRLERFGAQADIAFAFQHDSCPIVPYLNHSDNTLYPLS